MSKNSAHRIIDSDELADFTKKQETAIRQISRIY